jgi:hypothetical protein
MKICELFCAGLVLAGGLGLFPVAGASAPPNASPGARELAVEVRDVGWIAYGALSGAGDWDLFAMRPDGSQRRALTRTRFVLADSFLRMYQQDEPRSAGFIAHLAKELKQPLASLVNDGGASTLVRQELHRRPELLKHKRVVVWEFVERDIRLGTEGWQHVPLSGELRDAGPRATDARSRALAVAIP